MKFYGLFGEHLSHSLSPDIHKEIYRQITLEAGYKLFPFPPSQLSSAVEGIRTLTINGVNVTIPYKEAVIPYLDDIHKHAKKLQAVNTIQLSNRKLIGYNTDYDGFKLIFTRRNWTVEGKTAVVLGTGGAAKMVIQYLKDNNAHQIFVISRSPEAHENTKNVTYTSYEVLSTIKGDYLINTTPVGMYPNSEQSPVPMDIIQHFDRLIDLIYNPFETQFLSIGRKLDKSVVNGMDMLIGQAVRSVEIWENRSIPHTITDKLIMQFNNQRR